LRNARICGWLREAFGTSIEDGGGRLPMKVSIRVQAFAEPEEPDQVSVTVSARCHEVTCVPNAACVCRV